MTVEQDLGSFTALSRLESRRKMLLIIRDNRIRVPGESSSLSSGIIACARRVRERACAVDRQSKNWFLDRRSTVSIPEQVVFMSLFVRRIPVSTVVDNTQIRSDSSGCTRYALSPNFLRMPGVPERCERGPARFEIRGAKKPYGWWRGESVKRKISLGPPFPALLVFRIFADFFDAGSMHFSSRMDREKAMCFLFVKDVKLLEGTNLFRSRKSCGGNITYTFGDIIGCWSLCAIFEERFYMYNWEYLIE